MKLALIFLSAFVVISHQQFQPLRGMRWMPYSQQRVLQNYYQPAYYDNVDEDESPYYRQFRPSRPISYVQDEDLSPNLVAFNNEDSVDEDNYLDVQSRFKGLSRFRPSFSQQNPRFFLSYISGGSSVNPFARTVTFTLTSTINITSVQTCISAALFKDAAAQNLACRRKREILDSHDENEDDNQFFISPTETQQLTPSALPSLDLGREKRQLSNDQVSSSLDEAHLEETSKQNSRGKRFFNGATYKTVTSYSFLSTTITKAANIAAAPVAPALGPLLCRPAGYVIC